MDEILKNAKNEMNSSIETPDMWQSIHQEIKEDKMSFFDIILNKIMGNKMIFATGIAVVLLVVVVVINQQNFDGMISAKEAEKLANNIDKNVYKAQNMYEKVIAEMEDNCSISELTSDNSLAQAYFDKLALLDQMILVCKSSLESNPYNPEIHKQLFYAYNEKIKVYKELQNLDERKIS